MMGDEQGEMHGQQCEECGTRLYRAGDQVPAGAYLRVDDGSFHRLDLSAAGPLPASFDGHIAQYRVASALCVCQCQHAEAERAVQLTPARI
jgi:hypothetical protein